MSTKRRRERERGRVSEMRCSGAKWISNNTEKAFAAETLYVDRSFRYDFSIVTCACFSVATTAAVVVAQIRK